MSSHKLKQTVQIIGMDVPPPPPRLQRQRAIIPPPPRLQRQGRHINHLIPRRINPPHLQPDWIPPKISSVYLLPFDDKLKRIVSHWPERLSLDQDAYFKQHFQEQDDNENQQKQILSDFRKLKIDFELILQHKVPLGAANDPFYEALNKMYLVSEEGRNQGLEQIWFYHLERQYYLDPHYAPVLTTQGKKQFKHILLETYEVVVDLNVR